MKKIKLPISNSFGIVIDLKNLEKQPQSINGPKVILLGSTDISKQSPDLEQARENGGHVIWATTCIENKLESLITNYLFDRPMGVPNPRRDFFSNRIINSTFFSYAAKKELVIHIISQLKLLKGKDKASLQKLLTTVMDYRNAFAHGDLCSDNLNGTTLKYFSGGSKSLILDDTFWEQLEAEYNSANELLDTAIKTLPEHALKQIDPGS